MYVCSRLGSVSYNSSGRRDFVVVSALHRQHTRAYCYVSDLEKFNTVAFLIAVSAM